MIGPVGRETVPHGRNHHPLNARTAGQRLDFGHSQIHIMGNRHQCHPGTAYRFGGAELLQPSIVCSGTPKSQPGVSDHAGSQARAEGRRLLAGDGIAVGEDDLASHAVGIQHRIADLRVVGAPQAPLVLAFPLGEKLGVYLLSNLTMLVALGHVVIEFVVEGRIQVRTVFLTLQPSVGVGRDNDVRLVACTDLAVHGFLRFLSPRAAIASWTVFYSILYTVAEITYGTQPQSTGNATT